MIIFTVHLFRDHIPLIFNPVIRTIFIPAKKL
jgi:hypothetical protein